MYVVRILDRYLTRYGTLSSNILYAEKHRHRFEAEKVVEENGGEVIYVTERISPKKDKEVLQ